MSKLNKSKVEKALALMSSKGFPIHTCPNCGGPTVHLEDSEQDEAFYEDVVCSSCDIRLTLVYRFHYAYAQKEMGPKRADIEMQDPKLDKPWHKYTQLDALWGMVKGFQMQTLMALPEKGAIRDALMSAAKLVPQEEWPLVLVDDTCPDMLKAIAQEVLNGKH